MDAREERGRVIAAKCSIRPRGALWEVPSQSNNGTYLVNTKRNYCSCPDHAETGFICKHIFAVRFSLSKTEANPDGTRVPHFNSVLKFFDTDDAAGILSDFIARSAAPLAEVESQFAVDSTGFSGGRYVQWIDEKWGTPKREVQWVKLHAMVGVKTNVVTSCKVLDKNTADCPELPGLVASTAEQFAIGEVSADKAYLSRKNFDAVEATGGTFYPAFKKGSTGGVGGSFAKAYHLFALNREEYGRHYHQRSNVESTFSAIKRKFGEALRSKTDRAMKNETLAKVVSHNICCVISGMYELGIDPRLAGLPAADGSDDGPRVLRFPVVG